MRWLSSSPTARPDQSKKYMKTVIGTPGASIESQEDEIVSVGLSPWPSLIISVLNTVWAFPSDEHVSRISESFSMEKSHPDEIELSSNANYPYVGKVTTISSLS